MAKAYKARRPASGGMQAAWFGGYTTANRITGADGISAVGFGSSEEFVGSQYARLYLVEKCRAAYRKNGFFTRIINAIVENVIGVGFRVQPQTSDAGWNKAAKALYDERCKQANFTPAETLTERQAASLLCASHHRDGGCLVYHPYGGTQLFEESQIVTPRGKSRDGNVRDGVVFNNSGKLYGYYVGGYNRYGGYVDDGATQFLPAWHVDTDLQIKLPVCTYFKSQGFISGYRGIPLLAPCLDDLDRIGDYIDAILERAIEEACVMGTLHSDDPEAGNALSVKRTDDSTGSSASPYNKVAKLEPGAVPLLRKDEDFKIHSVSAPGGQFVPFVTILSRIAAAPASMPIEIAMMNFSDTNFAASRAAIEQFKVSCGCTKDLYATEWYRPNYLWSVYEAIKSRELPYRDDWQQVNVSPSGWRYLEPMKDAEAATERMSNRSSNLEEILAEQGKDLESHLRQSARVIQTAQAVANETGVPLDQLIQTATQQAAPKRGATTP